jgi:hypothetical protein
MTKTELETRIIDAFGHLYPDYAEHTDGIIVQFNDDETIDVQLEGITTFRAMIDSDNDDYLRFGLYDPDYNDEHPNEPNDDYIQIRVRVLGE